jgi:Raf kinase inhibitor-like YbhB/YbcL family protein
MRLTLATCVKVQLGTFILLMSLLAVPSASPGQTLSLASSAFENGAAIPERFTCSGSNRSPALEWKGIPSSTLSFALIVDDPDAPMGTFVHWVIYNISPATKQLPEGVAASAAVSNGEQGLNGRNEIGYTGPCPPPGKPHHYQFRLYALDQKLELGPGATPQQLTAAMKGHVLASAELVGIFERGEP